MASADADTKKKHWEEKIQKVATTIRPEFDQDFKKLNNGGNINREQAWHLMGEAGKRFREEMHKCHQQESQCAGGEQKKQGECGSQGGHCGTTGDAAHGDHHTMSPEKKEEFEKHARPIFDERFQKINNGGDINNDQAWQLFRDLGKQMREEWKAKHGEHAGDQQGSSGQHCGGKCA